MSVMRNLRCLAFLFGPVRTKNSRELLRRPWTGLGTREDLARLPGPISPLRSSESMQAISITVCHPGQAPAPALQPHYLPPSMPPQTIQTSKDLRPKDPKVFGVVKFLAECTDSQWLDYTGIEMKSWGRPGEAPPHPGSRSSERAGQGPGEGGHHLLVQGEEAPLLIALSYVMSPEPPISLTVKLRPTSCRLKAVKAEVEHLPDSKAV